METYEHLASKGHRVLAFAALALPGDKYPENFEFTKNPINYPTSELTFYGLTSLEDPPKHGVREAVGHCREAGVKVMMVTGDHPLTAEAIGRKINLMLQDTKESLAKKRGVAIEAVPECDVNAIVIHGEKVDSLTEADWDNIFSKEEIIFARTSPKHKLTIVKRAQSIGHIVGVTGDGVNDSPALKKADLGIAMNISGSDVSKEAAAMILVDDNFASTVNGIEEGRLIFQNLKKSVQYTITHTMPEVWANVLFAIVPLPLPLAAIQILVVDLGFELFMALSYAYDTPENKTGLMKLAPRKPVTQESISRLRKKALRKSQVSMNEPWYIRWFVAPVKELYMNMEERSDGDVLVDRNTLSWAYLEIGMIMTIGCFFTYFWALYYHFGMTPQDVVNNANNLGSSEFTLGNGAYVSAATSKNALNVGQSAYYLAIMIQQCFNLFICKARLGLPYGSFMFSNRYNFIGVAVGASFVMLLVYASPFNVAFQTSNQLSPLIWLAPITSGVFIYIYSIIRFLILQARNPIKYSRDVVGLQMYPTRWSISRGTGV